MFDSDTPSDHVTLHGAVPVNVAVTYAPPPCVMVCEPITVAVAFDEPVVVIVFEETALQPAVTVTLMVTLLLPQLARNVIEEVPEPAVMAPF